MSTPLSRKGLRLKKKAEDSEERERLSNETGLGLASIIGDDQNVLTEWQQSFKLSSELPLGQWHENFWGKNMADAQPLMPAEGSGLIGNELRGGDEPMDVCMSEGEDSDDDVIEGCYFLEIDIEEFAYPWIWVRAEYIRIYDALEVYYKTPRSPFLNRLAKAAVITGQPGIGKSVWIYYALRRRLAERKPVILYESGIRYLFVEEGVYAVPSNFTPSSFRVFVWTLVDSDQDSGVPGHLVPRSTRHFVIYCTSPCKSRWSRLHKTVRQQTFIMNPWKRKEILRVAEASGISHERVNDIFNRYGPTPRLCIDYLVPGSYDLAEYEADVKNVISTLTTSEIERLSREYSSLTMGEVSHKIFLINRQDRENVHSTAILSPITPSMKSRLASRFRTLERREQIRLFKYFSRAPESRALAGIFFEAAGQECLRDGMTIEFVRMVRRTSSLRGTNSRWHSSHVSVNDTLEPYRQLALRERQLLTIPKDLNVEEYTNPGPSSITSNVMYVPELPNQEALDSFIVMNGILYVFQFTIAKKHDIKPGLFDFFSGYTEMENWRFIFIIPPNLQLVCPQPWSLKLRNLQPYSAVIDLDNCPTETS